MGLAHEMLVRVNHKGKLRQHISDKSATKRRRSADKTRLWQQRRSADEQHRRQLKQQSVQRVRKNQTVGGCLHKSAHDEFEQKLNQNECDTQSFNVLHGLFFTECDKQNRSRKQYAAAMKSRRILYVSSLWEFVRMLGNERANGRGETRMQNEVCEICHRVETQKRRETLRASC